MTTVTKTIQIQFNVGSFPQDYPCCCGTPDPPVEGCDCDNPARSFSQVGFNGRTYTEYTDSTVPNFSSGDDFLTLMGASLTDSVWYSNDGGIEEWVWVSDETTGSCPEDEGVTYRSYIYDTNISSYGNHTTVCCDDACNESTGRYEVHSDTGAEGLGIAG